MEQRRFGRTGHLSAVAILGAFALGKISQDAADRVMEDVIAAGVNHIDVAPSYDDAELRLGPWLRRERLRFFVGCKTMERRKEDAGAELRRSLERLQIERFDLYQIHAVNSLAELDQATSHGGVLDAIVDARAEGLTAYVGITGHGMQAPATFREALRRFDFDTVLFPVNPRMYADPTYRQEADALLAECQTRDIGVMAIKAVARSPWGDTPRTYDTWYRPFDDGPTIQRSVDFALSQPGVTGLCSAGDAGILHKFVVACEHGRRLTREEQESAIAAAASDQPIFA